MYTQTSPLDDTYHIDRVHYKKNDMIWCTPNNDDDDDDTQ